MTISEEVVRRGDRTASEDGLFREALRISGAALTYGLHKNYPATSGRTISKDNGHIEVEWYRLNLRPLLVEQEFSRKFNLFLEKYAPGKQDIAKLLEEYSIGEGEIISDAGSWISLYNSVPGFTDAYHNQLRGRIEQVIKQSGSYNLKPVG